MLNDGDDFGRVGDKEDRPQDGPLRHAGGDWYSLWGDSVVPHELTASREVWLDPLNDPSPDTVVVRKAIEWNAMVDCVERGAEVEKAEKSDGSCICRLINVGHQSINQS